MQSLQAIGLCLLASRQPSWLKPQVQRLDESLCQSRSGLLPRYGPPQRLIEHNGSATKLLTEFLASMGRKGENVGQPSDISRQRKRTVLQHDPSSSRLRTANQLAPQRCDLVRGWDVKASRGFGHSVPVVLPGRLRGITPKQAQPGDQAEAQPPVGCENIASYTRVCLRRRYAVGQLINVQDCSSTSWSADPRISERATSIQIDFASQ
jgi:hypothetical protein